MIERMVVGMAGTLTGLLIAVAGVHAVHAVMGAAWAWRGAIESYMH